VFGFLSNEPGPDDILNAVNDALEDLTEEVNEKLDSMMGYVDTQVINSEKFMLQNVFDAAYRRWTFCLKEETEAKATECQADAAKRLVEDRSLYGIYWNQVTELQKLDRMTRMRIEAHLVLFRNYANLVVLQLLPLIETYCENPATKYDCMRFSTDLHDEVTGLIKYAQNAVQLILNVYTHAGNRASCPGSVECGKEKAIKEGWPSKHTMDEFDCKCTIEDSNTKQYCKFRAWMRADGRNPGTSKGWWVYNYPECNGKGKPCGRQRFAELILWNAAPRHGKKKVPVVKKYWEDSVLNMIPEWKEALKKAEYGMSLATAKGMNTYADQPSLSWYPYSPRYKEREELLKKEMA